MAKTDLEIIIQRASADFALFIVDAVKSATLGELVALQSPSEALLETTGYEPSDIEETEEPAEPKRKKRIVKNYPKCAYPNCNNNRFPRGKGFCGEHWRQWMSGEIEDAADYRK